MLEKIFKKSTKVTKAEAQDAITITGTDVSTEVATDPKVVDLEVAKKQKPLSAEKIAELHRLHAYHLAGKDNQWEAFARAIEKAHGIK